MPRIPTPLAIDDLSLYARALARSLHAHHAGHGAPPGHVALLNLLARAAGHRNLQSLQAARSAGAALPRSARTPGDRPPPAPLSANARKALMQFDTAGRLVRWPHKYSVQRLAMWVLWTHFDAGRVYTEAEVNTILRAAESFGDHVTLRRELINHRLLTRTSDCSAYRKLPARADEEVRLLLHAWRAMRRAGAVAPRPPGALPQPAARVTAAPR